MSVTALAPIRSTITGGSTQAHIISVMGICGGYRSAPTPLVKIDARNLDGLKVMKAGAYRVGHLRVNGGTDCDTELSRFLPEDRVRVITNATACHYSQR